MALLPLPGLYSSLRADDVWSLRTAGLPMSEMLATIAGDVHPPLYFLLFWPWLRLFGDTEVAMRALSLLLHYLAAAAVYRCAARALPRQTAWLAAIAYACAPLALLSTELVRMYSLLGLLSALSITAFQDVAEHPSPRRVALWTLINIAGSFTHLWWFCLLAGQALAAILCYPRLWRSWTAGLIASTLPYSLLWGPVLLRQLNRSTDAAAWLRPPSPGDLLAFLYFHLNVFLLVLPVVPFLLRRLPRPYAWSLPSWVPILLLGTLLPPLVLSYWKPFFSTRFTIVALPASAVLVSVWMARTGAARATTILLMASSLVILSSSLRSSDCEPPAQALQLLQKVKNDDSILYVSLSRPAIDFYLDRERPQRRWRESSFPSAIDTHPGFEGDSQSLSLLPAWRDEAASLAREIAQRPGARVFVFLRSDHQPSAILEHALAAALQRLPALDCHCPARSNYIDRLAVFEAPPNVPATALH